MGLLSRLCSPSSLLSLLSHLSHFFEWICSDGSGDDFNEWVCSVASVMMFFEWVCSGDDFFLMGLLRFLIGGLGFKSAAWIG